MTITLKAFAYYRDFLDKEKQIDIPSDTTIEMLFKTLFAEHKGLREMILDSAGRIKPMVSILKNGRNIVHLENLKTVIQDGDTIALFPPVAGG
ncbi:MAG TPA: MoaD/ThiS family protein [Deltaproteobacteria bacterium]|nr:MoaD/ThiS family protein [Deltaproteobacteria bacterium]